MNEMVERVARAIYAVDPQQEEWRGAGHEPKDKTWDEADADWRETAVEQARAAIAAMRDSTEAMKEAGGKDIDNYDTMSPWQTPFAAAGAWSAMISAALQETEK